MSTPTDAQLAAMADQIFEFNQTWYQAAELGTADTEGGSEWRHALVEFLFVLTDEERTAWIAKPLDWRLHNIHFDARYGERFQQDRPDFPRDVTGVAVRGPAYDSLGNSNVVAFVSCSWEQAEDAVTLIKERVPDGFDAHTVIGDIAANADEVPVYAGITAYLDHLAEDDA
jgi:hypothetical protein